MAIPSNKMKENINDMLFPNPQEINSCCYKTQEEEGKNNFWSLSDFSLGLREPQKNPASGLLRVSRIAVRVFGKKRREKREYIKYIISGFICGHPLRGFDLVLQGG